MVASANIGTDAYASYGFLDDLPYQCIKYLMNNDEVIWKLLKYNTPNAWEQSDLSHAEKATLIYAGQDNTVDFRVFMDSGQPDVNTGENCQIRISTHSISPNNRTFGTISILLEVFSHYKINHLTNYKTRNDMVSQRLLEVFNGKILGGVGGFGKFFFDKIGSESNRLENGGQLPYKGKWLVMSVKAT